MMRRASQNEKMAYSSVSLARSAQNAKGNHLRSRRSSLIEVMGQDKIDLTKKQAVVQQQQQADTRKKSIWSTLFRFPSFKQTKKETKAEQNVAIVEEPSTSATVTVNETVAEVEPEMTLLVNDFDRMDIVQTVGDEDVADIIIGYANKYVTLAEKIVRENSRAELSRSTKLLCGKTAAKMPLAVYLARIIGLLNKIYDKEGNYGVNSTGLEIIVMASVYIDRILKETPDFVLCPLNVHRTIFAAVVGAIKFSEDRVPDKFLMATIGGVDVKQSSAIESRFCSLINFRYYVSDVELQNQMNQFSSPFGIQVTVRHGNDEEI